MLMLAIYKGDPDQRQPRHPALDVRALHQSYLQDSPNPSGVGAGNIRRQCTTAK